MQSVLNPKLYAQLIAVFGRVQVINSGESSDVSSTFKHAAIIQRMRERSRRTYRGERYQVCCPECGDTRFRLNIHHEFGIVDSVGNHNWHLLKCFNEDCFDGNTEARKRFRLSLSLADTSRVVVTQAKPQASLQEARIAQDKTPFWELEASHPCFSYLTSRGFDPQYLSDLFYVGYAGDKNHFLEKNRLFIPVFRKGKLIGAQYRRLDGIGIDYPDFADGRPQPKYFTSPGFRTSSWLYNLDQARKHAMIYLTEGVTDVWSKGPDAVCQFGSFVRPEQAEVLHREAPDSSVCLLLDSDATGVEHKEKSIDSLSPFFGGRIYTVSFDAGVDPASFQPRSDLNRYCVDNLTLYSKSERVVV